MKSFYYLPCGRAGKEEDRHQYQKGENLVGGSARYKT